MNMVEETAVRPSVEKPWLKHYTKEAVDAKVPESTIYEYLLEQNRGRLDFAALNYYDRIITYRTLFQEIEKAAKGLSSLGVKQGDAIGVCAVSFPEVIYMLYAANRLGAVINFIDPRTSAEGIINYLTEADSKVLVTMDACVSKIEQLREKAGLERVISISPANSLSVTQKFLYRLKNKPVNFPNSVYVSWRKFIDLGERSLFEQAEYRPDSGCIIAHTGGTTGTPKGVLLSNENLNSVAVGYSKVGVDFEPGQRILNIMPPFVAYGCVVGIHGALSMGWEDILVPSFGPDSMAKLIMKYRPNHFAGVPTHITTLMDSKELEDKDLSFLISIGVGGDSLTEEASKKINAYLKERGCPYKVAPGYGMTESSATVCACMGDRNREGSGGLPMPLANIKIVDPDTGEELGYNEQGLIMIGGAGVMLGYYKNTDETEKVISVDSYGSRWMNSGDIGYVDEDGFVYVSGRMKRMIIRHDGFKVFPTSIENTIMKDIAVKGCCVIGIRDTAHSQGHLPKAVIELSDMADASDVMARVKRLCELELPEYAIPVAFETIERLLVTLIGKVDYRSLETRSRAQ